MVKCNYAVYWHLSKLWYYSNFELNTEKKQKTSHSVVISNITIH